MSSYTGEVRDVRLTGYIYSVNTNRRQTAGMRGVTHEKHLQTSNDSMHLRPAILHVSILFYGVVWNGNVNNVPAEVTVAASIN